MTAYTDTREMPKDDVVHPASGEHKGSYGSTARHTPGPWRVEIAGAADDHHGRRVYIVAEGGIVSRVESCANPRRAFKDESLPDMPEPSDGPIAAANAGLIASAPDLAALLEEAREALRELLSLEDGTVYLEEYNKARAAISRIDAVRKEKP